MRLRQFVLFFLFQNCYGLFAQLPPDFIETVITTEIYRPVGITFDENGQAYVWEAKGLVHVIDSSGVKLPDPLIDISEEVGYWGDHGCLGFALHPDFLSNGYFYLLYVVDRHHLLHFGTSQYNPDSTLTHQATIGRITRYTADPSTNFQTIIPNSRKILLGETIDSGFPILIASHGVGSLAFGTDGTLLASCGDGGSFLSNDAGSDEGTYFEQALADGIIRQKENIGSFKAQMVDCLNGKIIRINPETGDGVQGNLYFDSENPRSAASRVWVLGLRNPFRFIVRPGTGSHNPDAGDPGDLFIGDVGGSKWEELNIATQGGQNFGYPLFEGILRKPAFWNILIENPDAPNPLYDADTCQRTHFYFQELIRQANPAPGDFFWNHCDSSVTIDPGIPVYFHTLPKIMYNNSLGNKPNRAHIPVLAIGGGVDTMNISLPGSPVSGEPFGGYSSVAGCFYDGGNFPEAYRGKYFHADFSWWIRTMDFDENNDFHSVERFHDHADYILSMAVNPKDGCLYYVNFQSKVIKISYGGNAPPVALAKFDQQFGPSPHTVNFNASDSYDPDGVFLSFHWEFGDGTSSGERDPQHVFETLSGEPTGFDVTLTVTDSLGAVATAKLIISLNNTPPEVEIISFEDGDLYPVSDYTLLPLKAQVSDEEHTAAELTYAWQTFLFHNTHYHPNPIENMESTEIILEPAGCDDEIFWYRVELTVTDAAGLSTTDARELFPYCGDRFGQNITLTGEAKPDGNMLTWRPIFDSEFLDYEIQRSDNITDFKTIGRLEAKMEYSYDFKDTAPLQGINRYRLKINRKDGVYDYSNKVVLDFPPDPDYLIYPNPTSDILNVKVKESTGRIFFELFDAMGRLVVYQEWVDDAFDGLERTVDLEDYANGVYFYRLRNGSATSQGNLLILR